MDYFLFHKLTPQKYGIKLYEQIANVNIFLQNFTSEYLQL